jgi:hypothetical protein
MVRPEGRRVDALRALRAAVARPEPGRLVFERAALVVVTSIAAHGLADTVGARWVERQLDGTAAREAPA